MCRPLSSNREMMRPMSPRCTASGLRMINVVSTSWLLQAKSQPGGPAKGAKYTAAAGLFGHFPFEDSARKLRLKPGLELQRRGGDGLEIHGVVLVRFRAAFPRRNDVLPLLAIPVQQP